MHVRKGRLWLLGLGLLAGLGAFAPLAGATSFPPVQLDDSTGWGFYFPELDVNPEGTIFCGWASAGDNTMGAYGRITQADGQLAGDLFTIVEGSADTVTCPPELTRVRLSGGGEAQLVYHG